MKKTKRLNEEEVKQLLIDSLANNDTIETEELNEKTRKVEKPEDAADVIKEYEEILHTKRKGIISVAYHQGKMFSRFWEKEKFMTLVNRFGTIKIPSLSKSMLLNLSANTPG